MATASAPRASASRRPPGHPAWASRPPSGHPAWANRPPPGLGRTPQQTRGRPPGLARLEPGPGGVGRASRRTASRRTAWCGATPCTSTSWTPRATWSRRRRRAGGCSPRRRSRRWASAWARAGRCSGWRTGWRRRCVPGGGHGPRCRRRSACATASPSSRSAPRRRPAGPVAAVLLARPHRRRARPAGRDRGPDLALDRVPLVVRAAWLGAGRARGRVPAGPGDDRGAAQPRAPRRRRRALGAGQALRRRPGRRSCVPQPTPAAATAAPRPSDPRRPRSPEVVQEVH